MALQWPNKDPDERLDFTIDWSRFLDNFGNPVTIASVQWKMISGTTESSALSAGNTFDETGAVVATALGITVENITTTSSSQTNAAIVTKRVVHLSVKERV